MVRVGGLELLLDQRADEKDASGMTPAEQLSAIRERVLTMVEDQYRCFRTELEPQLRDAGIRRVRPDELSEEQTAYIESLFESEILPVATPMTDSMPTPPLLANQQIHIAVRLKARGDGSRHRYAAIPLRPGMGRVITVPVDAGYAYVLIEDVVRMLVDRFFPGVPVIDAVPFRITRNAGLSVQEDYSEDFLAQMEAVLDERKQSGCVRLEVAKGVPGLTLSFLRRFSGVSQRSVYETDGPMDLAGLMPLATMDGFTAMQHEDWTPQLAPRLSPRRSIFEEVTRQPVLLNHPYDSFEPVTRLATEAAADPEVLAIKQILYRTSADSAIIEALKQAASRGKYVTVIVELKARFDEARNIEWARELERAGVQVIYGIRGLKTHAKVCIVVRREPRGVARYVHFGTGNYNEKTARLYSDISYLTRDEDLAADASAFFNAICGYSEPQNYLKLVAAPMGLRDRILELIEAEIAHKREGREALVMAKMNSLEDPRIIRALYRASQAGVTIRLNVRGICCLRPGVKGLSKGISVVSIVDRFLEHSRAFYFHAGGEERVFISSADWMRRNLDRRIELLIPIEDSASRRDLINVLETNLGDTAKARRILPNGSYERVLPEGRRRPRRSQEVLYLRACETVRKAGRKRATVFESHRPVPPGEPAH